MLKKLNTFIILILPLSTTTYAVAGTGQIFSPAGLPQSSNQSYSPPATGTGASGTQNFPTPPLPLGEAGLQSFPGSSIPLENKDTDKQNIPNQASAAAQKNNNEPSSVNNEASSVSAFFQCGPIAAPQEGSCETAVSLRPPLHNKSSKDNGSPIAATGKVLWHVLDNLGVPMPMRKNSDLDPALSSTFTMSSLRSHTETNVESTPQKIPESELEGIEVSPNNDKSP